MLSKTIYIYIYIYSHKTLYHKVSTGCLSLVDMLQCVGAYRSDNDVI